jgi:hypothetical protein
MTAPPPVLSPSSVLPPPSPHFPNLSRKEKFGFRFKNVIISSSYEALQPM